MADEPSASGVRIRRGSGLPLYQQLVDQLRYLISAGRYGVGEYLPTMRTLADELDLNFNTVNRAYRQLQRDGLIESTPGKGATVVRSEIGGTVTDRLRGGERPVHGSVESILAAALERALAAGLTGVEITTLVERLLEGFNERIPPPPRLAVDAGAAWRTRLLADGLSKIVSRDVEAFDLDADRPDLLVRPRYGSWTPDLPPILDPPPAVDLSVLAGRSAAAALVTLDEGSSICAIAAEEGIARWLLDTAAALAHPSRARVRVADRYTADDREPGEWAIVEAGLPGLDELGPRELERTIVVSVAFPATANDAIVAALSARPTP